MSERLIIRSRRCIALTVSFFIFFTSPGPLVYSALANSAAARASAVKLNAPMTPSMGLSGAMRLTPGGVLGKPGLGHMGLKSILPSGGMVSPRAGTPSQAAAPAPAGFSAARPGAAAELEPAAFGLAVSPAAASAGVGKRPRERGAWTGAGKENARGREQGPSPAVKGGVRGLAVDIHAALDQVGPIGRATGESAKGLGNRLSEILSAGASRSRGTLSASPVSAGLGSVTAGSKIAPFGLMHRFEDAEPAVFGAPAGKDSIEAAVRSHVGGPDVPAAAKEPSRDDESGGKRAPLAWRLLSAGVAAIPALALGLPLIASGSLWTGGLVALASLGLVAMPFFGPKTPKFLRALPGLVLAGLGLFTAGSAAASLGAIAALSAGPFWMGALVALGGWGLYRFGRSENKDYFDEEKVLTAFFGAIGAVVGAGLAAMPLATAAATLAGWVPALAFLNAWAAAAAGATGVWGTLASAAGFLPYVAPMFLLMHLPGWVGAGIAGIVWSLSAGYRGYWRTMGSIKRDTVLYERLKTWSEAKLRLSHWNVFKVGAVWIPLWIGEGLKWAASVGAGAIAGAAQAPLMFLWGAAHDLSRHGDRDARGRQGGFRARFFGPINKFLAAWNHFIYAWAQGSKARVYNPLVNGLVPWANSESALKRIPASLGLAIAQAAWFIYTVPAFAVAAVIGFFRAFGRIGGDYDPEIDDPGSLRPDKNDSPWEKPDVGRPPVSDLIPPGLFAVALGLLPAALFGLPLAGISVPALAWLSGQIGLAAGPLAGLIPALGYGYLAASAAVALMPVFPRGTPVLARRIPGFLLVGLGLASMGIVPWLSFGSGALLAAFSTNLFWTGFVTSLSGFGLVALINKLAKERENNRFYSVDDPEYIGGYFGALGVLTGSGVALLGLAGWLPASLSIAAYATSLLLLAHLPKWVWEGVFTAAKKVWHSVRSFDGALGFWRHDTRFLKNMRGFWDYHLKGSLWEVAPKAFFLGLFMWLPTAIVIVAELAAAVVLGLSMGVARAPVNWAWGAAHKINPDARITRFIAGFARALSAAAEGSRGTILLPVLRKLGLLAAMDDNAGGSRRPTLKAAGAFLLARVWQAIWLAGILGLSGLPLLQPFLGVAYVPAWLGLPIIPLYALYAGFKNASGEKKKPGKDEWVPDRDDPDTRDEK